MQTTAVLEPKLLLNIIPDKDKIINNILNNNFSLIDTNTPMARYRGTIIYRAKENNGLTIIGWQRNILKIRGYSSSPVIITLNLDESGNIQHINLDPSFKGSKGVICSSRYFNNNVQKLVNLNIDKNFLSKTKTGDTHCFHITEVLRGIYTFYNLFLHQGQNELKSIGSYFEEENMNAYSEGATLYLTGIQAYQHSKYIRYALRFKDIYKRVCFDPNGMMHVYDGVKVDFILNGELIRSKMITINPNQKNFPNITEFIVECMPILQRIIEPTGKIKIFCTNLYLFALIGLITQAVAVHMFRDNYKFVFHVINSLQRIDEMPMCIGGLKDQREADKFFPDFKFAHIF